MRRALYFVGCEPWVCYSGSLHIGFFFCFFLSSSFFFGLQKSGITINWSILKSFPCLSFFLSWFFRRFDVFMCKTLTRAVHHSTPFPRRLRLLASFILKWAENRVIQYVNIIPSSASACAYITPIVHITKASNQNEPHCCYYSLLYYLDDMLFLLGSTSFVYNNPVGIEICLSMHIIFSTTLILTWFLLSIWNILEPLPFDHQLLSGVTNKKWCW